MKEMKRKNNKLKLISLTVLLIALIPMIIVLNAVATEFELENNANLEDNVGAVVASYSTAHTISGSGFRGYFNDSAYTGLESNKAIYCLWHGKALFNQHSRCTLNRIFNSDIDMDNQISFSRVRRKF